MVGELNRANGGRILLTTAAFVIVVAGMREAQSVLVPFLLSGFIAIIAAPALFFLRSYKVPSIIAIILVILAIALTGLLLGVLVGNAVDDFSAQLPTYQAKLKTLTGEGLAWLNGMGVPVPEEIFSKLLDPAKAMSMAAQGLSSLGGLLTNTFLILLTVVFILLEASSFPAKLNRILENPEQSFIHFDQFIDNIKRYMAIKTITSMLTGVIIYAWLLVVGVDYPVLWGVLAFFLNYVPNIGSIIAAIPALLLALIQLGPGGAAWAGLGFILANNLIGNVIEPRFMGKGLGLSSLVVFLSLVFWGWVLGTVGMFLSVPLTMTIKIALDSNDDTRWLAILLGPEIDDEPASTGSGGLLKGWRLPHKPNPDE
ncbi:MAG: AI-2E family transporter [Sedimenticola sp.]|uniref:AI-2E family transporter n=1 Tax=Sedimenticola thiotaurini TaxID=1543721 RepID=A0A558DEZ2_9GAMM|nr:AI-2E family transporter [Sedimenticola sp.]MCW8947204.1 AI-2E family transporter [Sedimenticola sp.]MCW8974670.1 AI-2E family transporter [Sedimenticola sp.]TVT59599.1 MAG: AI-2E family transporter [Sedimenticola thiotaurini]